MMQRVHLRIKGRVQGVCFRMEAREEALRLGIAGWVRNCSDGTVEAIAEGPEESIEKFAEWCRRGPTFASVTNVIVEASDHKGDLTTFDIVR